MFKFWKQKQQKELNITEPVIALEAELYIIDNWTSKYLGHGFTEVVHKTKKLYLKFYTNDYNEIKLANSDQFDWMTDDEKLFLASRFSSVLSDLRNKELARKRVAVAKELGC